MVELSMPRRGSEPIALHDRAIDYYGGIFDPMARSVYERNVTATRMDQGAFIEFDNFGIGIAQATMSDAEMQFYRGDAWARTVDFIWWIARSAADGVRVLRRHECWRADAGALRCRRRRRRPAEEDRLLPVPRSSRRLARAV